MVMCVTLALADCGALAFFWRRRVTSDAQLPQPERDAVRKTKYIHLVQMYTMQIKRCAKFAEPAVQLTV
jgi:hypothetical protein